MANNAADTKGGPSSVVGSRLDSITSWIKERLGKVPTRTKGMLVDDDEKPADDALSSMQERPQFDVDVETKREFAARDDLADRRVVKPSEARPSLLEEPEPHKGV